MGYRNRKILLFVLRSTCMPGGGGDILMSGIRVCATDQCQFFTSKNSEQAPNFELFSRAGPDF